ncbi:hypothetical protein AB0C18_35600 [Nonomuraea muscovyensis]|uniref:hypothetical protein n=1 Tax=Nonomuraea muscovyensis TaxID=1124761 RepID=UPI0033D40FE4
MSASTAKAEPMPSPVRVARFVMMAQVLLNCVGLAFFAVAMVASLWTAVFLAYFAAAVVLLGWLVSRTRSGGSRVRWAAVGAEAIVCAVELVLRALDPGLTAGDLVSVNVAGPVLVVGLLLTPAAGRWFARGE